MIITHDGDPATPEGISHIDAIKNAAQEALKGTPLAGANIYLAGTAATYKDIQDGAKYDLMIAGIAALSLILLIMMFITRTLVAAFVIVGTVALSLGASFGLSVLIWQDILGIHLFWIVLALAIILLLAVGSDYNLLLISRFKEEIRAGLNTGIIRAMAGSGAVVTAAGLVFAATMASFVFADLRILGQIGTTIALGLLFDTLIVRSFMTPSIAGSSGAGSGGRKGCAPVPPVRCFGPTEHANGSPTAAVGRRRPSGHLRIELITPRSWPRSVGVWADVGCCYEAVVSASEDSGAVTETFCRRPFNRATLRSWATMFKEVNIGIPPINVRKEGLPPCTCSWKRQPTT